MLKASKHEAGSKIRSRQRAVEDYDVDRPQVQAWRHVEPSGTNCPESSVRRKQGSRIKCKYLLQDLRKKVQDKTRDKSVVCDLASFL